jgi:hypothetical protein
MADTVDKKPHRPGPSELLCKVCGVVEMIRVDWQRCYVCYMNCDTRNSRTYPAFCLGCCGRLHR